MALKDYSGTSRAYLKELIERGQAIQNQQYDNVQFHSAYQLATAHLSDPNYRRWIQDVRTYSNQYLNEHFSFSLINSALNLNNSSTLSSLLSYLERVYDDFVFWDAQPPVNVSTHSTGVDDSPMYDVFISHANADKAEYVNELKLSLDKLKIKIFYDKDELEWGDEWKKKLIEGVEKAEFAIIVISSNFFGREWTEKELKEFLNRQNLKGQKIILPILYGITVEELRAKYPAVADLQVLESSKYTCDEIALKFAAQLIKRLKA